MPVNPYATTTTTNPYGRPVPPQASGQTVTTVTTTTTTRPVPPSGDTYTTTTSNPYTTSSRPIPPGVNNPYVQNPGSYNRPVPPPVITGGVVAPYRPTPPGVYPTQTTVYWPFAVPSVPYAYQRQFSLGRSTTSYEILSNFQMQNARAKETYRNTSMSQGELQNIQMYLVKESVSELLNNTYSASYAERKSVLNSIYQDSPMSAEMRDSIDQELIRREVGRIVYSGRPMYERESALDNLYRNSSMDQNQLQEYMNQLHRTY